jgi:hypothetical protein
VRIGHCAPGGCGSNWPALPRYGESAGKEHLSTHPGVAVDARRPTGGP